MLLYTDGGCSGNAQKDLTKRQMIAVVTDYGGNVIVETNESGGSNNIAELIAVKEALRWCSMHKIPEVEIITDSKNTISWVWGYKVGKKLNDRNRVLKLKDEINDLLRDIKLTLTWRPREENWAGIYIEAKYTL